MSHSCFYAVDIISLLNYTLFFYCQHSMVGTRTEANMSPIGFPGTFKSVQNESGRDNKKINKMVGFSTFQGVNTDEKGHIIVDEYQNTSRPGIYAVGDVCGRALLTPGRKLHTFLQTVGYSGILY